MKKVNKIVKTIMDAESKKVVGDCDSCGKSLKSNDIDGFWTDNFGRSVCFDCMNLPLDVLAKAFYAKSFKECKAVIREFDEECEDSFLKIEYV